MTGNSNPLETVDILIKTKVDATEATKKLGDLSADIDKLKKDLEKSPPTIILGINDKSIIDAERKLKEIKLTQLDY